MPDRGISLVGYRRALRFILPYRGRLVLVLLAGIAATGFGLLQPYISKLLIDDALAKLDALAKRQEEMAQQQGNKEQTFQQRWEQEMLRREAEQLQRGVRRGFFQHRCGRGRSREKICLS